MKTLATFILSAFLSTFTYAQATVDSIYVHGRDAIAGKVLRVTEYTVVFQYLNEDAEQVLGKYAVKKLVYGTSGRVQHITKRIKIQDELDWEKVTIVENPEELIGLDRVGEITGKNAFINYRTGAGADKVALRNLRKKAAGLGCAFILLTADKDINYGANSRGMGNMGFGSTQSLKRGIAYSY